MTVWISVGHHRWGNTLQDRAFLKICLKMVEVCLLFFTCLLFFEMVPSAKTGHHELRRELASVKELVAGVESKLLVEEEVTGPISIFSYFLWKTFYFLCCTRCWIAFFDDSLSQLIRICICNIAFNSLWTKNGYMPFCQCDCLVKNTSYEIFIRYFSWWIIFMPIVEII